MAQRIHSRAISTPSGTALTSPQSTSVAFQPGIVVGLEVFVPLGHNGLTGWAVSQANTQIIPETGDPFFVMDNDTVKWPLDGFLNSGDWEFLSYNTDIVTHTFYLRFLVNEIDVNRQANIPVVVPLSLVA